MTKEWEPENVFEVIGSEVARQILALASRRPMAATELADICQVSEPTVYRRIHALQEYEMLDESVAYDDDGHHYKLYQTNLEELRMQVDAGQLDVNLHYDEDYTDKFVEFWSDLEAGAGESLAGETSSRSDSSTDVSGGF